MKLYRTYILPIVFLSFAFAKAQSPCAQTLSIYATNAKAKNYDEAFKQLQTLLEQCPDENAAIYQYGERIYEHRLKNNVGESAANVDGLIHMLKTQVEKYPNVVNVTKKKVELARVMYKNDVGTLDEQYNLFHNTFMQGTDDFTDPSGLVYYFTVSEDMYKNDKIDLQKLFDIYDGIMAKVNEEQIARSEKIGNLMDKDEDPEQELTDKETKEMGYAERNLKSYGQVQKLVDKKLGTLADCDVLIPRYKEEFEENKADEQWLGTAIRRLNNKDCNKDPFFVDIVKALNEIKPSAKTSYSLGRIAETTAEKIKYFKLALEQDPDKRMKSDIHYALGNVYKDKGQYGSAKREYNASVQARPNFGLPLLKVADMIARSANSCGDDPFTKRAVNWVAARYARKAASIDPSIKSNALAAAESYSGRAPGKSDIFTSNYESGQRISFSCWIGEGVTIP